MTTLGLWAHFRPFLLGAGLVLICGGGCQNGGNSDGSSSGGNSGGSSTGGVIASEDSTGIDEANCVMLEPEIECGSFELLGSCEPDEEGSTGETTGTSGGADSGEESGAEVETTGGEASAGEACVLQAIADQTSFSFTFNLGLDGKTPAFATGLGFRSYAVDADGSGWGEGNFDDGPGACSRNYLRSRQPVVLGGCTDLECVIERLDGAADDVLCRDVSTCPEG